MTETSSHYSTKSFPNWISVCRGTNFLIVWYQSFEDTQSVIRSTKDESVLSITADVLFDHSFIILRLRDHSRVWNFSITDAKLRTINGRTPELVRKIGRDPGYYYRRWSILISLLNTFYCIYILQGLYCSSGAIRESFIKQ